MKLKLLKGTSIKQKHPTCHVLSKKNTTTVWYNYVQSSVKINSYLGSIARHASVVTRRRRIKSSLRRAEQFAQKLAIAKSQPITV